MPLRGTAEVRVSTDRAAACVEMHRLVRLVSTRTMGARWRSQLRTHPHINRERLHRRNRAVVEQHVRYRDRDRRLRIEEGPESREFAIEQVVYNPVDLQLLGELIRAMQVRDQ